MKASLHTRLFLAFLLLSGFSYSQSSPHIQQFRLDNGLSVILNEDHLRPEVFGLVVVKAGSKNDPSDATGMAHYQEHMLFKGTEELGTINWEKEKPHIDSVFLLYDQLASTRDEDIRKKIQLQINEQSLKANEYAIPNELSNIIKSMGGTRLNANTGADRTVFFNAFPSNQLEKWLDLYSHRFINPVFRGFQSELEVVYEEKNLYSDMFQFALIEEFNKNLFRKHPYGQQTAIGTIEDLKNPSLTKMYDFFRTYYVANNMALVLSGDFSTEEVMPLIREKFGKLRTGEIPPMKEYLEEPFRGRELIEKRLSPIKIAMLGFRTVPNGHPDEIALEVCNGILSNRNETGLLDRLNIENKIMAAMVLPMNQNDYGTSVVFIVPKLVGQKLESAEDLVVAELKKLREGNFDESTIEAVKNQLYVEFQTGMESLERRTVLIAEQFAQNRDISEILLYPEKVKKITREDVLRVANAYYGENYLAFFSKMGRTKKEKIEKPGYKPVLSNTNAESAYAKHLKTIQAKDPLIRYIDFNTDVAAYELKPGVKFYSVRNPVNDIFNLEFRFGIGEHEWPDLKYVSQIMGYSGVEGMKIAEFKNEFARIGCSYSVSSDESYLTLSLQGIESNLLQSLKLLNKLMTSPVLEKEKLQLVIEGEKTNRKMERSEPDNVSDALFQFVKYGNQSSYLNRLSMKEIGALNTDSLVALFRKALSYECEVHFTGQTDPGLVKAQIENEITFSGPFIPTTSPVALTSNVYNESKVFFTDKKKAVQSKIYLFANGPDFDFRQQPYQEAFNLYFGGDFSGLVLQEIREYRSLAYTAGAGFMTPILASKPADFTGYVGTQADKTIEALNVFNELIHSMPEKRDRLEMIRQYLSLSALTKRPNFRDLSKTLLTWKQQGYVEDPLKFKMEKYQSLGFEEIVNFYTLNLKTKPLVISIVGNPKNIDMTKLAGFGKIEKVREENLFR